MDVLVTYDIDTTFPAGERRLVRVAHVCEAYGARVQKSVFECRLTPARLQRLVIRLADLVDPSLDSINVYTFSADLTSSRLSLGRRPVHEPGKPWIM